MSETFQVGQHQVKLSKIDNRLVLEVEAHPSGRSFSLELNNDVIAMVSNQTYADVDAMYHGLVEALKKARQEISLTLDSNGKVPHKLTFPVGSILPEHQFALSLQEKIIPQNKIVEMISKMEAKIFEKLDNFEKRIALLEGKKSSAPLKKAEKDIVIDIDPKTAMTCGFNFSNDNLTVQWKSGRCELSILNGLPKRGKIKISIVVEIMTTNCWIGLSQLDTSHPLDPVFRRAAVFKAKTGRIETDCMVFNSAVQNYSFQVGSTVTMIIDIDSEKVSFEVNGQEINSTYLDLKKNSYIPYIDFIDKEDRITITKATFEESEDYTKSWVITEY